jgi:hypothetical protein
MSTRVTKTVGAVRAELVATSEIPKLDKTVGADAKPRLSKAAKAKIRAAIARALRGAAPPAGE